MKKVLLFLFDNKIEFEYKHTATGEVIVIKEILSEVNYNGLERCINLGKERYEDISDVTKIKNVIKIFSQI